MVYTINGKEVSDHVMSVDIEEVIQFMSEKVKSDGCEADVREIELILTLGYFFGWLIRHGVDPEISDLQSMEVAIRKGLEMYGFGMETKPIV